MAKIKDELINEEVKSEAVQVMKSITPSADPDMVVAAVVKRYSISLPDKSLVTYAPGNVTMPREHAEHWYSIASGTQIIGIPDTGNLDGAGAKVRLGKIVERLSAEVSEINAFEKQHENLTRDQKEAFAKSAKLIDNVTKMLGGL